MCWNFGFDIIRFVDKNIIASEIYCAAEIVHDIPRNNLDYYFCCGSCLEDTSIVSWQKRT